MGRPVNADGRQTREAVLDAALSLFAEQGYFGTSLRDIAATVGVRESALYNYFRSKEDLFNALIGAGAEARTEQIASLLDEPITDPRAALTTLVGTLLDHYELPRQERLFRVLMADGLRLARSGRINLLDRVSTGQTHMRQLMMRLIAEGWLRRADPSVLALTFFGPVLLWRVLHAAGADHPAITNRRAFVRAHVEQFLNGAGAPTARPTLARQPPSGTRARRTRGARPRRR